MLITKFGYGLGITFFFFFQTSNGQVEAKVQCFYRKRDLSSALAVQAEKHLSEYSQAGTNWAHCTLSLVAFIVSFSFQHVPKHTIKSWKM